MKIKCLFILVFALPVLGCSQRLRATTEVGDHIYLEYFYFNPAGVDKVYLTDSVNFRVFVGEYDTDHEKIGCEVKGDTLVVFKNKAGEGRVRIIIDQTQLSRAYLEKNKVNSTEPLFKFR